MPLCVSFSKVIISPPFRDICLLNSRELWVNQYTRSGPRTADGSRIHLHLKCHEGQGVTVCFNRCRGGWWRLLLVIYSCCHPAPRMNINALPGARSSRCGAAHYVRRNLEGTASIQGKAGDILGQRSLSVRTQQFPHERSSAVLQLPPLPPPPGGGFSKATDSHPLFLCPSRTQKLNLRNFLALMPLPRGVERLGRTSPIRRRDCILMKQLRPVQFVTAAPRCLDGAHGTVERRDGVWDQPFHFS